MDKNVQMMDAGMALFQTEKPYGTVLGGLKVEMQKSGKVFRTSELPQSQVPEMSADCDLFLDFSNPMRKRYISCKLEYAGLAGETQDGEPIHRYAASFKEGNKNTLLRVCLVLFCVLLLVLSSLSMPSIPLFIKIIVAIFVAVLALIVFLRPSISSQELVKHLIEELSF